MPSPLFLRAEGKHNGYAWEDISTQDTGRQKEKKQEEAAFATVPVFLCTLTFFCADVFFLRSLPRAKRPPKSSHRSAPGFQQRASLRIKTRRQDTAPPGKRQPRYRPSSTLLSCSAWKTKNPRLPQPKLGSAIGRFAQRAHCQDCVPQG